MEYRTILVEARLFGAGDIFILIDKLTNTVIGRVKSIDETEIYRVVLEALGEDVEYKLEYF